MKHGNRDSNEIRSKLNIAVTMMALAVIALATATYAWFTLSLSTNVKTMELNVTTGVNLQISTDDSSYGSSVDSDDVKSQIGKPLSDIKITPLTSKDGKALYPKSGNEVTAKNTQYLQFDLYFKGDGAMDVYLTEENSTSGNDGTKIEKATGAPDAIAKAIRVSFQVDGGSTSIYQWGTSDNTHLNARWSGEIQDTFTDAKIGKADSKLFSLTTSKLKQKVTVRIWMEGDDVNCTDAMKEKQFLTRLRFEGQES